MPLVGFAVYSNFSAGVRIWQRLNQQTPLEDLSIYRQKMSRTFESVIRFSPIPFEADKDGIVCAAFITTDEKLGGEHGVGEVRIFYDDRSGSIKREEKNLSLVYRDKPGKIDNILAGVTDLKIMILSYDKQDDSFKWLEEWQNHPKVEMPLAVKLEFNFSNAGVSRHVTDTFLIPIGGIFET